MQSASNNDLNPLATQLRTLTGASSGMNGLVLAGGHSRRMGQPKSLLDYHSKPQYKHIAELLSGFCEQVFISCRSEQQSLFEGLETILDSDSYGDIGPLNGVLTAYSTQFSESSLSAWLIIGCDYPLLEKPDLEQLVQARNPAKVATVFTNPETQFPEPLLGIYEAKAGPLLLQWFQQGNESLRRFLEQQEIDQVIPEHPKCLKSVDTLEQMTKYKLYVQSL